MFSVGGGVPESHGTSRALDGLLGGRFMRQHVGPEGVASRESEAADLANTSLKKGKEKPRYK